MSVKRIMMVIGAALVLAVMGFVGLHGAAVLAQDGQELGLIVYPSNRTGDFEIYVLNPTTGLSTPLTNSPTDDIEPQWSPDGEQIVFTSDRDGDFELFVMNADGTEVKQLTFNNAEDRQPRWQPGGAHVVYYSDVNGKWDMYVLTVADGMVRQLTNDAYDERGPMPEVVVDTTGTGTTGTTGQTTFPTLTPQPTEQVLADAVVDSTNLNIRANPGTGAQIVGRLQDGDEVTLLGQFYSTVYLETWVRIRAANGTEGWVFEPLLILNIPLSTVPTISAQYIAPPPTATPTPAATAAPSVIIEFWADRTTINSGECVTLNWQVEGIKEVYFQGTAAVGQGSSQQCPAATTTYNLRVVLISGVVDNRYITITVN